MCTWFKFENDLGNTFFGRTQEAPGEIDGRIAIFPRGHMHAGSKGTFGFVALLNETLVTDGMNEKGLSISTLDMSETTWVSEEEGDYTINELAGVLLGQYSTVQQVIDALSTLKISARKMVSANDYPMTLHLSISDPSNRSVVAEFHNGVATIYENKLGVMCNDPQYPVAEEMFAKLDPKGFDPETFQAFNYSCEDRYMKMACFNAVQIPLSTDVEAINRVWSMLNTVDIVQGAVYWPEFFDDVPAFTSYSLVGDLTQKTYYLRTYDNYDVRKIALADIDFDNTPYTERPLFVGSAYRDYDFKLEQKPQMA